MLDATDFEVVHTNPLPSLIPSSFKFDGVVLDDSSYVINATIHTPDRAGYVLHVFNWEGDVVRSFDEAPFGTPGAPDDHRWLTVAQDGGIWSIPRDEYRMDLWDPAAGARRLSLVRAAEWFPPPSGEGATYHPDRPGPPRIDGITEDSAGRVWVLVGVPSERWADCFAKTPPNAHPEAGDYTLREKCMLYDRRIEVFDPRTARLLATANVPRGLTAEYSGWWAAGDGLLYSVEEDAVGFPVVRLWRPALRPVNNERGRGECGV